MDAFAFTVGSVIKAAALELDVEKGDIILTGRFKNSPQKVETMGTDKLGQPTINGRKALTFRIEKLMPKSKQLPKSASDDLTRTGIGAGIGAGVGGLGGALYSYLANKKMLHPTLLGALIGGAGGGAAGHFYGEDEPDIPEILESGGEKLAPAWERPEVKDTWLYRFHKKQMEAWKAYQDALKGLKR
jgi:hypothetical protein